MANISWLQRLADKWFPRGRGKSPARTAKKRDSYRPRTEELEIRIVPATTPTDQVGVYRAGTWFLNENQAPYAASTTQQSLYGASTDIVVTGDWLADGLQRLGVFRNGTWFLDATNADYGTGTKTIQISYGAPGDIPVVGKWVAGDPRDHIGVFRN